MAEPNRPLILVTNDDGIDSPGLRAAVRAVHPLGRLLVAAPARQWSSAGRSFASPTTTPSSLSLPIGQHAVPAYQIDAPPALVVLYALLLLAPRQPDLAVSGINFGENLGSDVTVSGTVGAALQAASLGVPALAASLQTPKETHAQPSDEVDFSAAAHFTRLFADRLLQADLPPDADVLKLDVPDDATPHTPWRLTRVSRLPYFVTLPPGAPDSDELPILDYEPTPHPERAEPDSDLYALAVDRVVSVSPLSIDLTARTDFAHLRRLLAPP